MRIGNLQGEIEQEILDLGFTFVDCMTLLGFKLTNTGNFLSLNFDPVLEKIRNSVRYWERFYLSLPGKIAVYKCLLLSQVSYRAAILMPGRDTVRELGAVMENFVTKGISVARDRIYRPVHEGGLGLIPLEQYIQGLHCSWFKRAHMVKNDNWKYDLYQAYKGDIINIKAGYTEGELGTVLTGLVSSYTAFQHKFTQYGNNYMCVPILNNENFGYGRNQSIRINQQFFGFDLMDMHGIAIRALRWQDCTINGAFVPIRQFNEHVGIPFTREQYYDLKTAYTRARKKLHKDEATSMDITEFLMSFKKGSRKFRKILGYEKKPYDLTKLTQVISFARITNTNIPRVERLKNLYSIWGRNYLNNDVRVFLFKYYNNILGLGNRIAHFVQNADARCTFCVMENRADPVPESFEHIFFSCPSTQLILRYLFEKFFTKELDSELYFTGSGVDGNEKENVPFSLTLDLIRYQIWQCKLNKRKMTAACITDEISYIINCIRRTNREISDLYENCTMFTRRNDGRGDAADQHGRG